MRKTVRIALLALILVAMLPGAALAAEGDANLAMREEMREKYDDYVVGACALGDELCIYGNAHIFTWHAGDAELTALDFEKPEAEEDELRSDSYMFSDGERLYLLSAVYDRSDEESSTIDRLELLPVELDGDAAHCGEPVEVDIDELVADYGDGSDSEYLVQISDVCWAGGYAMLSVYDPSDRPAVYQLDVESGEGEYIDGPEEISGIAPYEDGKLLIRSYQYEERCVEFWIYDPEEESLEPACEPIELGEEDRNSFSGMAYSRESGRLFYLDDGYVKAMDGFDYATAEPVAELSTAGDGGRSGLLLPGDRFVYCSYDGVFVRQTDPGALPETRLVVRNGGYSEATTDAYYAFGSAHPDVAVVLNGDYQEDDALIESMMNRDDSTDVYILQMSRLAFDALYNRGFMAELDSEEIAEAVGRMYPPIRDALTRDGEVVAVPVSVYGWVPGLDVEGFEKIGIAQEALPGNLKELIEFLPTIPERLPDDGSITLFNEYETQESVRSELLGLILETWRTQSNASGRELRYDDPELKELMEAALELDYEALGLPEGDDTQGYSYSYTFGQERKYHLVQFSAGCTFGNFYSDATPTPMSPVSGEEGYIPLTLTVAFVNPFSKNVALAQEFLEELVRNMETATRYSVSDELNEPVRNEDMLNYIDEIEESIEESRAKLQKAEDVDKPAIEEEIANLERAVEDLRKNSWTVSQEDIDWYRAHAGQLTVDRYNFLNAADEDGELSDMAEQLLEGRVSVEDFLNEADRKVRMRAMEGN